MNNIFFIIIAIGFLSVSSFYGGKLVFNIIKFKSKIVAGITALIFLFISALLLSSTSGAPTLTIIFEKRLVVFFIIIVTSAYYGYVNSYKGPQKRKIYSNKFHESDEISNIKPESNSEKINTSEDSINKKEIGSNTINRKIDFSLLDEAFEKLESDMKNINNYPDELINEFLIVYYQFFRLNQGMNNQGSMKTFNEAFLNTNDIRVALNKSSEEFIYIDLMERVNKMIPLLEKLRKEEPENFKTCCDAAIDKFKKRTKGEWPNLLEKARLNNIKASKSNGEKMNTTGNNITKKEIDSDTIHKNNLVFDSAGILSKMKMVPIENTIFELSLCVSMAIENEFEKINPSKRIYVLWEVSIFYSILAYTCLAEISDGNYKEKDMHNTFGVMAREIATNDEMNKETKRKAYEQYLRTIFSRVKDYEGASTKAQKFCMNLFRNIAQMCKIKDDDFWLSGSSFIYGVTLQFINEVQNSNGHYRHIV